MNFEEHLPRLMPDIVAWAEEQYAFIRSNSRPLRIDEIALARAVGVEHPERVRICVVDEVPRPETGLLGLLVDLSGFLGPMTFGLTLSYGVFLRRDIHEDPGIKAHEFRHVKQYEHFGSIAVFVRVYLRQVLRYGYANAPLEVDAEDAARRALDRR